MRWMRQVYLGHALEDGSLERAISFIKVERVAQSGTTELVLYCTPPQPVEVYDL